MQLKKRTKKISQKQVYLFVYYIHKERIKIDFAKQKKAKQKTKSYLHICFRFS